MRTANLKNLIAACIFFSFIVSTTSADIIVVNPGESIQAAIDSASYGNTVEVAAGTYHERITLKNGIAVIGAGYDVTVIDGDFGGSVVISSNCDANTVLEGFTIKKGSDPFFFGGGMCNFSSRPTVTNCIFTGNFTYNGFGGGGMFNDGSSPMVTNCTFSNNTSGIDGGGMLNQNGSSPTVINCMFIGNEADTNGGGMYNDNSSPTVTNCTFIGNSADSYGGGGMHNYYSSPTVTNCKFIGNEALYGGGMYNFISSLTLTNCTFSNNTASIHGGGMYNSSSSPTVTNCTFTGNEAFYGGGMYNSSGSPTVTNCILWGNTPDEIFHNIGTPIVTYSDVQGGYTGTGNIDADPFFADAQNENLRLLDYSPCVDAGNNNAVPGGVTTDLDGNPRFVEDAGVPDTGSGTAPIVDMGAYERQVNSFLPIFNVTQGLHYLQIQASIDGANAGDEIEVSPGTYNEAINFVGKEIRLYSSGGRDVTIIDASGLNSTVVTCNSSEDADTILEGFTITGGNASGGGGMLNDGSSPMVTNCIFSGNKVTQGAGGMLNQNGSSPTVINCTFIGNGAGTNGGGMYNLNISSPTVTNCTFRNNTAGIDGGGMFNRTDSNPSVINCTFTGNMAGTNGGGMANYESNPFVINCIFWDNTPYGIYNYSSVSVVLYSDVQGGYAGTGNIDADPCFVDANNPDPNLWNLRLQPDSPCIDAGDTTALPAGIFADAGGNLRGVDDPARADTGISFLGVTVDMGAYEFQLCQIAGDINCDGVVDFKDLAILCGNWLKGK